MNNLSLLFFATSMFLSVQHNAVADLKIQGNKQLKSSFVEKSIKNKAWGKTRLSCN